MENYLLIGAILLFFSLIAGKTSYRFGVPTLILFMIVGILARRYYFEPNNIRFEDYGVTQFIGMIALNFILFSGGLSTSWSETKPIFWQGLSLSTLGVVLTALFTGFFWHLATGWDLTWSFLLGAIVSSTDSAAVFSVLRAKNLGLANNLKPMLEFESGSNDPMAYFLTITCIGLVTAKYTSYFQMLPSFFLQLIIGIAFGYGFGRLARYTINHIRLEYDGLYFVLMISIMFFSFAFCYLIKGNGFLSVYITGLTLGNLNYVQKNNILKVFDGMAWLMQIIMFLTLGLLVSPHDIISNNHIWGWGLVIAVFMILFSRPVAVFISLLFFKSKTMSFRERLFVSWVGLKGAVPIVFATYPLMMISKDFDPGHIFGLQIFNVVFFISTLSLVIQGTTIPFFAKLFGVDLPMEEGSSGIFDRFIDDEDSDSREIRIKKNSPALEKLLFEINFPNKTRIALISRHNKFIIPDGQTRLEENDIVFLFSENKKDMESAVKLLRA